MRIVYVMVEKIVRIIEHDLLGRDRQRKGFKSKAFRTVMLLVKCKNTTFYSVNTIGRSNNSNVHWKKEGKLETCFVLMKRVSPLLNERVTKSPSTCT